MHFKLLTLLYEDSKVITTEFAAELQHALNEFQVYHMQWKSKVNIKNNVVIQM